MVLRDEILAQIKLAANEHGRRLSPLVDDLPLVDSGIDSLCLAVICARLEGRLGIDPFAGDEDTLYPVTLGGFIKLWERAPMALSRQPSTAA